MLEELEKEFPFWSRLHGFWRTLPNINPYTVSSEPGQDLVGQAMRHILGEGQERDIVMDINGDQDESNVPGEPINDDLESDKPESDKRDTTAYYDEASEAPESPQPVQLHFGRSHTSSYNKAPSSCSISTKVSSASSKRTRLDAFREENEMREKNMVQLASKKIDYKTAELAVKKQKLDLNNQREMEKERLVVEERMLQQKERMQEKEHLRQKQTEEHQERILRLQIELAQTHSSNFVSSPANFSNQLPAFSNPLPSNFEHFTNSHNSSYDGVGRM